MGQTIYERGDDWIRIFRGDLSYVQENTRKFVITPAQMTNLFASPVGLIPAVPGFSVIPTFMVTNKPADPTGGTYAAGGATNLDLTWGTGGTPAIRIVGGLFSSVLTGSAANLQSVWLNLATTGAAANTLLTLGNYGGLPLSLTTTGGNFTTTSTAPLILLISFRMVPLTLPLT